MMLIYHRTGWPLLSSNLLSQYIVLYISLTKYHLCLLLLNLLQIVQFLTNRQTKIRSRVVPDKLLIKKDSYTNK